MERDEPVLRVATLDDEAALDVLMKESAASLFPLFYDEQQARSAVRYVPEVDRTLLEDGTYFVLETGGEAVACGGWSRRDRLYTGSGDLEGECAHSIPRLSPHGFERCSSAPTGRDAASAAASSRPAKKPRDKKASDVSC